MSLGTEFNLSDLRVVLADSIRGVASETTNAAAANAIANLSGKLINTYRIQMDYARMIGKAPNIKALNP